MVATVESLLVPKLMSFDVFGTLIDVRGGSYAAFESILADANAPHVDVKAFWEHWEERNIAHYWEPYRRYRDICELSLAETFEHFGIRGAPRLIQRYFDAFPKLRTLSRRAATLDRWRAHYRLAVVSNIDDDLLALTPLEAHASTSCAPPSGRRATSPTAALFRYLIGNAGCARMTSCIRASRSSPTWWAASRSA